MNYRVIDKEKYYRSGVFRHFAPIINWGKYREENGRLMMPVSVRLNHAIADGFLVANVYRLLEKEMIAFCNDEKKL